MPFQRIPRVSDLLPGSIKGLWTIGDPDSWHVEIGTNSAGKSGIRLYGADGVTPLIDLSIGGTPTITSAIVQTDTAGQRVVLSGPDDALEMFTGNAAEIAPSRLSAFASVFRGVTFLSTVLKSATRADGLYGQATVTPSEVDFVDSNGAMMDINVGRVFDANGNPMPRWATDTTQRQLAAATVVPTLDANGEVVIAHGLANAPLCVVAVPGLAPASYSCEVGNIGAANFTVRVFVTNTGARAAGVSMTLRWYAIG